MSFKVPVYRPYKPILFFVFLAIPTFTWVHIARERMAAGRPAHTKLQHHSLPTTLYALLPALAFVPCDLLILCQDQPVPRHETLEEQLKLTPTKSRAWVKARYAQGGDSIFLYDNPQNRKRLAEEEQKEAQRSSERQHHYTLLPGPFNVYDPPQEDDAPATTPIHDTPDALPPATQPRNGILDIPLPPSPATPRPVVFYDPHTISPRVLVSPATNPPTGTYYIQLNDRHGVPQAVVILPPLGPPVVKPLHPDHPSPPHSKL